MIQQRAKNYLIATAVSVAATLGSFGSAQAAVYTGSWDPAFGSSLPSLGWKGEASFFIPDACLAMGAGLYSNSASCSAGGMKLLSSDISFYNLSAPSVVLETLHYSTPATSLTFAMRVDASHQLSGVIGAFDYLLPSNLSIAGGPNTWFGLAFVDNAARMGFLSPQSPYFGFSELYALSSGAPNTFITFAPAIPEPSTYAMLFAGLAVMWQLRRRRQ